MNILLDRTVVKGDDQEQFHVGIFEVNSLTDISHIISHNTTFNGLGDFRILLKGKESLCLISNPHFSPEPDYIEITLFNLSSDMISFLDDVLHNNDLLLEGDRVFKLIQDGVDYATAADFVWGEV